MDAHGPSDETQTKMAAERLMADIRSGRLPPGHKLRVAELKKRYGIGASPLREALSHITSLGYATTESRRGYRVADMSPADLDDITRAREVIETGMLAASMTAGDPEWEVGVVAAMERVRRAVAKAGAEGFREASAVATAHKQLHAAIVSHCGSARLISLQELLFDQAERYREVMVRKVSNREDFVRVHERLVKIVLGGDVDAACRALRAHLNLTPRDVYGGKLESDGGARSKRRSRRAAG